MCYEVEAGRPSQLHTSKVFLQYKYSGACQITDQCQPGYLFKVPEEIYFFHPHSCHSCCRTYDQNTATGTGTVSQECPEIMVGWKMIQWIHALRCCHQWNIVNYC